MRLRRGGPGSAGSWPCTSTGRIPYKNKNQRRVYAVSRAAERPNRTADAPERATREIRSPQVITLHRTPGARKSSRDQRTDTRHGKAVDSCGQRGAVPRLSTAVGRRPTGCTELARCAGPALPASTALSFVRAHTADAGPELSQPASTPVLSAGRLLPAMSTRQNLFCIVLGAVPDRSLTLREAALVTC